MVLDVALIVAACTGGGGGVVSLQQDAAPPNPDWQFVLAGIESNRRQIRSGEVEIEGRTAIDGKQFGDEPAHLYLAFDAKRKRWRLDRDEPGWLHDPKGPSTEDPKHSGARVFEANILGRISKKYFRTEDVAAFWWVGNGVTIGLAPPDKKGLAENVKLFDPRALGLYMFVSFESGQLLDATLEFWRDWPFQVEVVPGERVWKCTAQKTSAQGAVVEWQMIVEPDAGFAINRLTCRWAFVEEPSQFREHQVVEARWEKQKETWVPVSHRISMSLLDNTPQPKVKEVKEWKLKWARVNEELPDELFSVEGFKPPEELGIVDFRMAQPVVLRQAKGYETAAAHIAVSAQRSRWRAALASLALLSFVAVIVVVAIRRRRALVRPTP